MKLNTAGEEPEKTAGGLMNFQGILLPMQQQTPTPPTLALPVVAASAANHNPAELPPLATATVAVVAVPTIAVPVPDDVESASTKVRCARPRALPSPLPPLPPLSSPSPPRLPASPTPVGRV